MGKLDYLLQHQQRKGVLESYLLTFSTVISQEQHNEKKVVREANHSITILNKWLSPNHTDFNFLRMLEVIGSHDRVGFPCLLHSTFTP